MGASIFYMIFLFLLFLSHIINVHVILSSLRICTDFKFFMYTFRTVKIRNPSSYMLKKTIYGKEKSYYNTYIITKEPNMEFTMQTFYL